MTNSHKFVDIILQTNYTTRKCTLWRRKSVPLFINIKMSTLYQGTLLML